MRVPSLGWEYPLEEKMAMYSSILVLRIPWAEEPGRPQSIVSQRVGHDWGDLVHTHLRYSWCTILYATGAQYSESQSLKVILRLEAGFPGGSDGNKSACSAGDLGLIRGLGRYPREGKGCPFQYSGLENSHGQRSLAGYSPWGHSRTRLSDFHSIYSYYKWNIGQIPCVVQHMLLAYIIPNSLYLLIAYPLLLPLPPSFSPW